MTIISDRPASSRAQSPTISEKRRGAFAEAALGDAFRGRDLSLASEPHFIDRSPNQQPKRLGEIVEEVTAAAARRAMRYWQKEAALAVTESERQDALDIATKIARTAGVAWPEQDAA